MKMESSLTEALPRHGVGSVVFHLPRERRVKLLALTCLVFFTTCGGAFGLEPLIGAVGPGWAVLLIVVTPFVWSLPAALMVGELGTMMPEEGGFYVWVREGLGPFWAVQEAWWSMAYLVVVMAGCSVLFVSYLTFFVPALAPSADAAHPGMGALLRWLVAAAVIVLAMALNLRGARDVGGSAKITAAVVLGVFGLLVLACFRQSGAPGAAIGVVMHDLAGNQHGSLLLGLSYIVFNYSGWDGVSTYAAEVDEPQRTYPRAIALALVVVVLVYLLPVIAGLSVTTDGAVWSADAGWPEIARLIGGRWLGALMAMAGIASTWGLLNAQLLSASRLPFIMACDGWLPKALARVATETAVPKGAIVCFCAITALFAALSFGSLAVIQCVLVVAGLTLEFLALILLRLRRPTAARSFRVPGGWWGIAYVCVTPFAVAMIVLYATLRDWRSYPGQLLVIGGVMLSGVVLYFMRRVASAPSRRA
jgi:amino acid transporter